MIFWFSDPTNVGLLRQDLVLYFKDSRLVVPDNAQLRELCLHYAHDDLSLGIWIMPRQ